MYSTAKGLRVDIRYDGDTLWMTQAQMGELFGRDVSTISRHVSNIFAEGELPEEGNLQKTQIPSSDKPVTLYNLDEIEGRAGLLSAHAGEARLRGHVADPFRNRREPSRRDRREHGPANVEQ